MFHNPPDSVIREILASPRRVAVVGCSPDSHRDSHRIAGVLMARGHTVIPVNPAESRIFGQTCYAALADIPGGVEMVDIFRRSSEAGKVVDEAIAIAARIVWMQLGVIDETAAKRATDAGLVVVMDRCPAVEYRRLF